MDMLNKMENPDNNNKNWYQNNPYQWPFVVNHVLLRFDLTKAPPQTNKCFTSHSWGGPFVVLPLAKLSAHSRADATSCGESSISHQSHCSDAERHHSICCCEALALAFARLVQIKLQPAASSFGVNSLRRRRLWPLVVGEPLLPLLHTAPRPPAPRLHLL